MRYCRGKPHGRALLHPLDHAVLPLEHVPHGAWIGASRRLKARPGHGSEEIPLRRGAEGYQCQPHASERAHLGKDTCLLGDKRAAQLLTCLAGRSHRTFVSRSLVPCECFCICCTATGMTTGCRSSFSSRRWPCLVFQLIGRTNDMHISCCPR